MEDWLCRLNALTPHPSFPSHQLSSRLTPGSSSCGRVSHAHRNSHIYASWGIQGSVMRMGRGCFSNSLGSVASGHTPQCPREPMLLHGEFISGVCMYPRPCWDYSWIISGDWTENYRSVVKKCPALIDSLAAITPIAVTTHDWCRLCIDCRLL